MSKAPETCSFLTFNLFADLPTFRHLDRRLEIAADTIAARRPAIVALQEIVRSRGCGDMGVKLCAMVNERCGNEPGYHLQFEPADGLGEDEWKFEEGVALMSRLAPAGEPNALKYQAQVRITASVGNQEYRLPDDRVAIHRRYLIAPGMEVDAYATHLTDRNEERGGVKIRALQAGELLRWIARTSAAGNAVMVGGDFNDVPESETIRALTGSGFIDVHAAAGSGAGFTNDRNDLDLEAAQAQANQRIDYVFFRPGRASLGIEAVELLFDRPWAEPGGKWLWASDHFGVLARFALS